MDHEVISLRGEDKPIELDPLRIKHGYVLLPISLREMIEAGELTFAQCFAANQPKFANRLLDLDVQLDVSYMMASPEVKIEGLKSALANKGLYNGHSFSVGRIEVYINGGPNMAVLFTGVCWKSESPKIIVSDTDYIIPLT